MEYFKFQDQPCVQDKSGSEWTWHFMKETTTGWFWWIFHMIQDQPFIQDKPVSEWTSCFILVSEQADSGRNFYDTGSFLFSWSSTADGLWWDFLSFRLNLTFMMNPVQNQSHVSLQETRQNDSDGVSMVLNCSRIQKRILSSHTEADGHFNDPALLLHSEETLYSGKSYIRFIQTEIFKFRLSFTLRMNILKEEPYVLKVMTPERFL